MIYKNRIAISDRLETSTEKACVLAEEIGHYHTAVGDIINLQDIENLKQEQKGRLHGYNRMIGLRDIISAIDNYVIYCIPNLVIGGTYRYITLKRLYINVALQKKILQGKERKNMNCPKCGSEHCQVITETTSKGKDFSASKGCCGAILLGPIGILLSLIHI